MHTLRQSTAAVVQLGPFLSSADGLTEQTGLTVQYTDIFLSKNGGTLTNPTDTNQASHDRSAWYKKQVSTSDTDTPGRLLILVKLAGSLQVWREFEVLTAQRYDSMIGGSDNLQVDVVQVSGSDATPESTITVTSTVVGSTVTVIPNTTWNFTINGLPDLSGALANGVIFTAKGDLTDPDSSAVVQVQEGVGLLYIGSAAAGDAAKGSLIVGGGEDSVTILVNASQTGLAEVSGVTWEVKTVITEGEDADQVARGSFVVAYTSAQRITTT